MKKERRGFLKKLAGAGAVAASAGTVAALASEKQKTEPDSNGVVVGHSRKKEILYRKTAAWEEYYKNAL